MKKPRFKKFYFLLFIISVFFFPKISFGQTLVPKEKYEKHLLCNLKIKNLDPVDVFVDQNENSYVLHLHGPGLIEIFDKNGNSIKKINWESPDQNGNYRIRVDENGNILIYPPGGLNEKTVILDKDGKQKSEIVIFDMPWKVGFSNGNVFSERDGESLFKSNETGKLKRKLFFKDVDSREDVKKMREKEDPDFFRKPKIMIPLMLGNFDFDHIEAIDDNNCIYALYATKPKYVVEGSMSYYDQNFEICKFDPSYQLLAIVPSHFVLVNPQNGNMYEADPDDKAGVLKIYRWDKTN